MLMNEIQFGFFVRMTPHYVASIKDGLKLLLETKHLYQNIKINHPDKNIVQDEKMKYYGKGHPSATIEDPVEFFGIPLSKIGWTIKNPQIQGPLPMGRQSITVYATVEFIPPDIKLFCTTCKRAEAYNFLHGSDLLEFSQGVIPEKENLQVFSLAYQCQSCKGMPEIFIVRRDELKLILSGRTPMEEVELPSVLPKEQKKYFSDALIAYNSGQTLAGNFLLRTFIEQYIRKMSSKPNSDKIEPLFDEYSKDLPDDFKNRFPSLKNIYDKLSADLHLAGASEGIFSQAKDDIIRHFDAKRLFELHL